jgi:predicted Zn-dependent protease
MDTGNRQHLQDIYSSEPRTSNEFTPQVSSQVMAERKREMRNQLMGSLFMGLVVLGVIAALVVLVVRQQMQIEERAPTATVVTTQYIPRYSLPNEQQWVLDHSFVFADPAWDGEGDRPFNSQWVMKAAFNLIHAKRAFEIGQYEEAAKYFENALTIFPEMEGVNINLGQTYFKLKQFDKALALLEKMPEDDLTFDIFNNLGASCIEAKAYEKAEHYLNKAIELRPAYAEALKNKAVLYTQTKREDEAINAYEQYLDLRAGDEITRHQFALYLTRIGRWEAAAQQLRMLTETITNQAQLYYLLARAEMKLNNNEAAIMAMQRGAKLNTPEQALVYMNDEDFDKLRESEDGFRELERSLKQR